MKVELVRAQKILDQQTPNPDAVLKLLTPLLKRDAKHWLVYYFLGIAQLQKANFEKAIHYFDKSNAENSENAQTYFLIAKSYYGLQNFGQAELYAKAAIKLKQEQLEVWMFLGNMYWEQALLNKAIQCYTVANKLDPKNYEIAYNIAQIYADQGDFKKALELFDITLQMQPNMIDAMVKKAQVYQAITEYEQAEEALQSALSIDPENLLSLSVLSLLYRAMGKYKEAIELNEMLLKRYPNDGNVRVNYALCLVETGQYDKAEKNYVKALQDAPETQQALSNYLMGMHYNPKRKKEDIFIAHALWDQYYAPKTRPERPVPKNLNKDKILRVGFISGGFKKHPVGWMITSALEQLPSDKIETYIYTTDTYHDSLTKRIRKACAKWTSVLGFSDEVIAQLIKDDEIDILVELSGHSSGNRLKTVALEPAPVSVKWVGGLFNTSGLKSMDYLLTDAKETPEGEEKFYTEKLVRMPDDYVCFTPPNYELEVTQPPSVKNGYITFGCFNNPTKINTDLLKQWAEILKQVPDSKLFLKSKQYDTDLVRHRIVKFLSKQGIPQERVLFEGYAMHNELLATYSKVDIALDPWPYSGGLTTIEALWMGVPVITNSGPTFAGRHSTSHLINAGFSEWVSDNWEDYIQTAVSLASDISKLSELRAGLRGALLQSPVCDASRFGQHLAQAFREMWHQRIDGYENGLKEREWQNHISVEPISTKEEERSSQSNTDSKKIKKQGLDRGISIGGELNHFENTPSDVVEAIVNYPNYNNGKPMKVAIPKSEIFRLKNIFEQNEYALPKRFQLNDQSVVVDIGGNVGSFSLYARQWNENCAIHSFEPNPQVFPLLGHNAELLGNISINQVALSDRDGSIDLYQHPNNTGQTSTTWKVKDATRVSVPMRKSGDLLAEKGISKIDVLKIDTEGAEVGILHGMKDLLINTGIIMLEYHSEEDRREIDAILTDFSLYDSVVASPCQVGTVKYINNRLVKK